MRALLSQITGVFTAILLVLHTVLAGCFVFVLIFFKFIVRGRARDAVDAGLEFVAAVWVEGILAWVRNVQGIEWDIDGIEALKLRKDQWHLVVANHQSWVDIFVLFHLFNFKIPFLKFFIKQQLIWIPIVGQAWWALDFPFMKRYSREYLEKHPEKAGEDLKATQRACEVFARRPSSVMTFVEGTRFRPEKHARQQSPYRHLLKPKAGGLVFTVQSLGDRFSHLTNVTIDYCGQRPEFWDLLCGQVRRIRVRVSTAPIPEFLRNGDYQNDAAFKQRAFDWLDELWQEKDADLDALRRLP